MTGRRLGCSTLSVASNMMRRRTTLSDMGENRNREVLAASRRNHVDKRFGERDHLIRFGDAQVRSSKGQEQQGSFIAGLMNS